MLCAGASGAIIPLGSSGWQAEFDSSLDPFVDINYVDQVGDSVIIQKAAEFTQGPDPLTGLFPTIPIVFRQVGASTVSSIVISDEIITNSTGVDWTDFHWDVLDGPDAFFDSGPGFMFDTTPLTNQMFSPDDRSFWVDGFGVGPGGTDAVVADGSVWFPGDGAINGNLVINVVSTGSTVFTLKETPTPEPGTLVLLALGGLAALRRQT
jgi:hypothetical protein